MKKIILLIFALFPALGNAQDRGEIHFSNAKDYKELLAEAKTANKPIFIDAYTTWCSPCKQMDKEVFTDKRVADFVNKNYIAIRVQMDSTKNDNADLQKWRREAMQWEKYTTAYPCFLFFSPDGNYLGRELGYHNADMFVSILKNAIDSTSNYKSKIENFKRGSLDKKQLLSLAYTAKENKDSLAIDIARLYKQKYIDPLPLDSLLNPRIGEFIANFSNDAFNINDPIFQYMLSYPEKADSLFQRKRFSSFVTERVVEKEYITQFLPKVGGDKVPDWKKIEKSICDNFNKELAERLIIGAKQNWAMGNQNFNEFARLEFDRIERFGRDTAGFQTALLNNIIYGIVFKKVEDPKLLKKASLIMNSIVTETKQENPLYLDTYASILYKAGQKNKALEAENNALEIAKANKDQRRVNLYSRTITAMKNGEKLWEMNLE